MNKKKGSWACIHCGKKERNRVTKACPKRTNGGIHEWIDWKIMGERYSSRFPKLDAPIDGECMYHIAHCHEMSQDTETALFWYRKAANLGHIKSMMALADMYRRGRRGMARDTNEAVLWYERAADAGHVDAMVELGNRCGIGADFPQGMEESTRWCKKAAEHGHVNSMFSLAKIFQDGNGISRDMKESVRWYTKAAEHGHVKSMVALAEMYQIGNGIPKDMEKSAQWYTKAAFAGDEDSMFFLGCICEAGDGLPQDLEAAEQWYQKAFDAGDILGRLGLGRVYERRNDRTMAMSIYKEIAGVVIKVSLPLFLPCFLPHIMCNPVVNPLSFMGDTFFSTNNLDAHGLAHRGYAYEMGLFGFKKDMEKAVELYQKAAVAGDEYSMFALGRAYETGTGILKDEGKAIELFRSVAMTVCQKKCNPAKWRIFQTVGGGITRVNHGEVEDSL